jgi:membrane protease YdiL (CAAX protease family)
MSPAMRRALLWAPVLVVGTTAIAFAVLPATLGRRTGTLAAFLFYWVVWGALFSLFVLKPHGLRLIFRWRWAEAPSLNLLLLHPPLAPALFGVPPWLARASAPIVGASAVIALVNGTLEEVLWRGTYLAAFPRSALLGIIYPALGFAVWHISPQLARPSHDAATVFWSVSGWLLLGLIWGAVAWRTRSVVGSVLSHVVTGFLGFGAFAYLR